MQEHWMKQKMENSLVREDLGSMLDYCIKPVRFAARSHRIIF